MGRSSEVRLEAQDLHLGPLLLRVVSQYDEVANGSGPIAYMIEKERLDLEADRLEHPDRGPFVGHDLDDELRVFPPLQPARQALTREALADPGAATARVDDDDQPRDVAGPSDAARTGRASR